MTPAKRSDTGREIGARIRGFRSGKGLSQEALANLIGTRQATVSGWERGDPVPSIEDLYNIAWVLDQDVHDFLPLRREEEPPLGVMRAIDEQIPSGTNIRAALAIFLQRAAELPPPGKSVDLPRSKDPQRAAETLLKNGGVDAPPVDVVWLGHRSGIRILPWEGMPEAMSGVLVQMDDAPTIAHNPNHPEGRGRFTIAHEIGHLVLGHLDELHIDVSNDQGADERPGYNRQHETAANTFAANLLMPARWVRERARQGEPLEHLAATFGVSKLAMGYRLMSLGLSTKNDELESTERPGNEPSR